MQANLKKQTPWIKKLRQRANAALLMTVIALPFVIVGARHSVDGMRISPEKWVSKSHSQREAFERYRQEFEGNDVVYVSWDGCTIDDSRLRQFENQLSASNQLKSVPNVQPFERILTGASSVESLMDRPLRLTKQEAIQRLEGFLIGADQKTSCAVVVLTYSGNEFRRESIQHLLTVAEEVTSFPASEIILAGPPHDGVSIDDESIRGVNLFGLASTLVAAIFCFYCLRSWRISGLILGTACLGQGFVLAGIYYTGFTLDAILIVAPPLIFVLTVSAGIHFVNYFMTQPASMSNEEAMRIAWEEGWKPCWLATLTTAIGLCSLAVSGITPIAVFGTISAAGLILTVSILMCFLPDALLKWPLSRQGICQQQGNQWLKGLSNHVPQHPSIITALFVSIILIALTGARSLRTSVDVTSLFADDTKIIRDYNWIESNIGASVPVEVIVRFDKKSDLNISERIDIVHTLHAQVAETEGIQSVMSAMTFLPDQSEKQTSSRMFRKAMVNKRLHAARSSLDELNYLFESDQQESWRITGRVFATQGLSYGKIGQRIKDKTNLLIENLRSENEGISIKYTGMMPLIENVQVTILDDLLRSLLTAFALIGLSILLVLRSWKIAAVVTVLNTFPVLVIFGLMGGMSIPIDIGTMMTAGVAMGIAVDDTVHFLCYYRNRVSESNDATTAVKESIEMCGAAMWQTTLICAAGMLVFAVSDFVPTRQFGLIMASILVAAVVSDLVCLPALLLMFSGKMEAPTRVKDAKHQGLLIDRSGITSSSS